MPFYTWVDKKTGKEIEVLRIFSDYEKPPTKEEAPDAEDPEWERQVGGNQSVLKSWSWGPGKGNW
jgi:hypothetical protein